MGTKPTQRVIEVACTSITLYPYAGPFDETTAEHLYGIQSFDLDLNMTDVQGFGGDSIYEQFTAEVKRETQVKFSAFDATTNVLAVLLGGELTVENAGDPASEMQYWSTSADDSAPFFRAVMQSSRGTGITTMVFPKLRATGTLSWKYNSEQITMPELNARAILDKTYIRQDGKVGAAYDRFWTPKGGPSQLS